MVVVFVGCRFNVNRTDSINWENAKALGMTQKEYQTLMDEVRVLQLGTESPYVLPPEKAHKTLIKTLGVPEALSEKDLYETYSLAGRIPGLRHYEVYDVRRSDIFNDCYSVVMREVVLSVKKKGRWSVYRIDGAPLP